MLINLLICIIKLKCMEHYQQAGFESLEQQEVFEIEYFRFIHETEEDNF